MITFYVYYNNFCCFVLLFNCRHSSCRIFEDIKAGWLADWLQLQLQLQLDLATLICHSYGPSMSLMLEHNLWHEGIIIVIIFIGVVAVAIVDDNSILMANCRVVFILMMTTTTMIIIYYLLKIRKLPKEYLGP